MSQTRSARAAAAAIRRTAAALCLMALTALAWNDRPAAGQAGQPVGTALIVSVDVSNSVDEHRYKLQMEGIAKALQDPGVVAAITSGSGILFSMVTWADRPNVALPWRRISTPEDAFAVANEVRRLPRQTGEFTCLSRMLRNLHDKVVPQIPAQAARIVIDVSGDGPDNCNAEEPTEVVRDEIVASGVTINGLPILEGREAEDAVVRAYATSKKQAGDGKPTLEDWYRDHVMGGTGAFLMPADGFSDFGRAMRQKFMIEISGIHPGAGGRAELRNGAAGPSRIR